MESGEPRPGERFIITILYCYYIVINLNYGSTLHRYRVAKFILGGELTEEDEFFDREDYVSVLPSYIGKGGGEGAM